MNEDMHKNDPQADPQSEVPKALVDELDVNGIKQGKYFAHGRLLSAATRQMPVVEFLDEALVMHPPEKPFEDDPSESAPIAVDDRGILLDENNMPKKVAGARYKGRSIWWLGEKRPGTMKHFAAWFDDAGVVHRLLVQGQAITTDVVYKLRNRTHDGELGMFPDLASE